MEGKESVDSRGFNWDKVWWKLQIFLFVKLQHVGGILRRDGAMRPIASCLQIMGDSSLPCFPLLFPPL